MKSKIALVFLVIVSFALYAATIRGMVGNPLGSEIRYNLDQASQPFELSPERGRYLLVLSLAEDKSFSLSKELADAAYPDDGYYKGKYYIYFAPGVSMYALPFYYLFKPFGLAQVGTYAFVSIIAILNLCLLYIISRQVFKMPIWASLLSGLIFGFATTSWSYAITLYQHQFTVFFILLGFYSVWRYRLRTKFSWVWALVTWTGYALSIFVDYPNAFLLLPVMIYLLISALKVRVENQTLEFDLRVSVLTTAVLFAVITFIHGYYNTVHFGSPLRVSGALVGHKYIVENGLENAPNIDEAIKKAASDKDPVSFFNLKYVSFGLYTLFVAPDRGLFRYVPLFVLIFPGLYLLWKKHHLETKILLGTIGVTVLLYTMWDDPWGGWAYGPRYLIPIMAIFAIAVAYWASSEGKTLLKRIVTFVLLFPSVGLALLGAVTTNAIPPEVEGRQLDIGYTFMRNIEFLQKNRGGSLVYNTLFSHNSLMTYFLLLFTLVMVIFFVVLFVLPDQKISQRFKGAK
ncbi:MAG: hypothetical protein M3Q44_02065 [bacterium]|nr:hypothetical protein [bacterium]